MNRRWDNFIYAVRLKRLHWKLPLRLFSKCKNLMFDLIYSGKPLGRIVKPAQQDYYHTESTDYAILSYCFGKLKIDLSDVLVDVGCGMGRVISWWLKRYPNEIIGVEYNKELAERVRDNFSKFSNVTVICGDILDHMPSNGTVFYLFNPFNASIMHLFEDRLRSLLCGIKQITIVYVNCKHADVFENSPFWKVDIEELKVPAEGICMPVAFIRSKQVL